MRRERLGPTSAHPAMRWPRAKRQERPQRSQIAIQRSPRRAHRLQRPLLRRGEGRVDQDFTQDDRAARSRRPSARRWSRRLRRLERRPSRKRRWHAWHGGHREGEPCQGAPSVGTPFMTAGGSAAHGRPRPSGRRREGKVGSGPAHWASVSSMPSSTTASLPAFQAGFGLMR